LAKYPESNLIYRKMLRVSAMVEAARQRGDANYRAALTALYQGQCNCAYWHGLFGGLYLQHLRSALMSALLQAEALLSSGGSVRLSEADHDGDLDDELLFESPTMNLYLSPTRGGSALELDLLEPRHHLTGVLGRRPEAYHQDVSRAQVMSDEDLQNVSAHDLVRACQEGLTEKLIYDAYPRGAFVSHLLPGDAEPEMLDRGYAPLADFANARFTVLDRDEGASGAHAELACELGGYRLAQTVRMGEAIEVSWELSREGEAIEVCFGSQIDVTLLTPEAVGGRRFEVNGAAPVGQEAPGFRGRHEAVTELRIVAESMHIDVAVDAAPACELWRLPIETVSQSERGFESAYQGTALVFAWRGVVGAGRVLRASLTLG
jgi:alpha-amylase